VLEYDPGATNREIRLAAVGWQSWHLQQVSSRTLMNQIR
jgi:hypothetical protein